MNIDQLKPAVAPEEHGTVFHRWWEHLPKPYRFVIFVLGMAMVAAAVWKYATQPAGQDWKDLAGYALFIVLGILLAMPPFGLWVLDRIPLPTFLHRKS